MGWGCGAARVHGAGFTAVSFDAAENSEELEGAARASDDLPAGSRFPALTSILGCGALATSWACAH